MAALAATGLARARGPWPGSDPLALWHSPWHRLHIAMSDSETDRRSIQWPQPLRRGRCRRLHRGKSRSPNCLTKGYLLLILYWSLYVLYYWILAPRKRIRNKKGNMSQCLTCTVPPVFPPACEVAQIDSDYSAEALCSVEWCAKGVICMET